MAKKKRLNKEEKRYLKFDEMFDDLPDGAYFAAMEEQGFYPEDIIELSESIAEKQGAES